jgi:hypothetical protein
MDQARLDFRRLVAAATPADLRRRSDGTRWTNQQLLFHVLFGYLIVRALLVLVRVFSLLPAGASKTFARLLDSARGRRSFRDGSGCSASPSVASCWSAWA